MHLEIYPTLNDKRRAAFFIPNAKHLVKAEILKQLMVGLYFFFIKHVTMTASFKEQSVFFLFLSVSSIELVGYKSAKSFFNSPKHKHNN